MRQLSHIYNKEYKVKHEEEHAKAFLLEHEFEPWFQEKYNPMCIYMQQQA